MNQGLQSGDGGAGEEVASRRGVIHGVVRDSNHNPRAMARVFVTAGPTNFADVAALTDQRGRFSIAAPGPGTYMLGCVSDAGEQGSVEIEVSGPVTHTEIVVTS